MGCALCCNISIFIHFTLILSHGIEFGITKLTPLPSIDEHVGARLVELRKKMGLSQSDVAKLLKVTYQQVQKYESGASRVGAEKVKVLSDHFEIPVAYFFTEFKTVPYQVPSQQVASEVAHLIAMFLRIDNPESRDKIVRMAHELLDQQVKGSMRLVPKASD